MELLKKYKKHGVPLTLSDISRLDTLSEKEVITGANYLQKATALNLRLKRKQGRNFVKFTIQEIKQQISDVINQSAEEGYLKLVLNNVLVSQNDTVLSKMDVPEEKNEATVNMECATEQEEPQNSKETAVGKLGIWEKEKWG